MEIVLTLLGGFLSFLAGIANGMMDISMGNFKRSRIAHWNMYFWEMFGEGQSWKNKYVGRDSYKRIRVTWKLDVFGYTLRIVKPVIILDGWHMMKMCWRILSVIAVIPLAIVFHNTDTVIILSALLYFPQFFGFITITYILSKKS